jgi:hypothetical protein
LLDHAELPFVPSLDQKDLLLAQNYLIKIARGERNETLLDKQEAEAYNKIFQLISQRFTLTQIVGGFIGEKGYQIEDIVDGDRYYIKPEGNKNIKSEIQKTSSEINELILKLGVKELKSIDYDNEFKNSQSKKIEPKVENINKRGYRYKVYEKE